MIKKPLLSFREICTFAVLYKAYLAARRGKRSRAATAHYEVHLLENIVNLVYILSCLSPCLYMAIIPVLLLTMKRSRPT